MKDLFDIIIMTHKGELGAKYYHFKSRIKFMT